MVLLVMLLLDAICWSFKPTLCIYVCLNCMAQANKIPVTKTHKREVASPPMKVGLGCQGVYPSCGVDAGASLDLDAFPLRLNKFEAK